MLAFVGILRTTYMIPGTWYVCAKCKVRLSVALPSCFLLFCFFVLRNFPQKRRAHIVTFRKKTCPQCTMYTLNVWPQICTDTFLLLVFPSYAIALLEDGLCLPKQTQKKLYAHMLVSMRIFLTPETKRTRRLKMRSTSIEVIPFSVVLLLAALAHEEGMDMAAARLPNNYYLTFTLSRS